MGRDVLLANTAYFGGGSKGFLFHLPYTLGEVGLFLLRAGGHVRGGEAVGEVLHLAVYAEEELVRLGRLLRLLLGVLADGVDVGSVGEEATALLGPLHQGAVIAKAERSLGLSSGRKDAALGLVGI